METLLNTLKIRLKDEQDTLKRLLDNKESIDRLIKEQEEKIYKTEAFIEEEKNKNYEW